MTKTNKHGLPVFGTQKKRVHNPHIHNDYFCIIKGCKNKVEIQFDTGLCVEHLNGVDTRGLWKH